ncbi:unnamed protein product [Closterium sp. NIES-53]
MVRLTAPLTDSLQKGVAFTWVVTAVVAAVEVVAAVPAVTVELFDGELLAVASSVSASPLQPQQLHEWCTSRGGGGGSSGSHSAAVPLGVPGGGLTHLQRRPSETLTPQQLREWYVQRGASPSSTRCPYVIRTGDRAGQTCGTFGHTLSRCFSCLSDTWRAEFGDATELPRWLELARQRVDIFALDYDAILTAMYALSASAEGDSSRCVPPDPGVAAAALCASASGTPPGTAPAEALHSFTLDSGASRCFFRDSTTLTPLPAPVSVRLAHPSGGPLVARSSTVLQCPAVPSGSLSGLHLPSFSTNLVSTAALQDAMVTTTTPGGPHVLICTCTWMGRHLATFTRRPGSSLYTLATEPPQVAASAQVSASGQVAASCSCRLLSHETLLWHHRLGHPSLPRLRGMHSRLLVSGLPRSLPPLPPSPAPPCLPCVEGRQRAAPHSSLSPPTTAPLQTLHMDVKGEVSVVLIPWIHTVRLQLSERFGQDLPVLRLHSDKGAPHWLSHGGRSYLHDQCGCSPFSVAVCGPVRCAPAQPLALCLLAGDLAHTTLDGEGWRCGDPTEPGAASAGGAGAGVAGIGGHGAGGAGAAGAGAVDPGVGGARGTVRPRPYFVPLLQQVLGVPSSTGLPPPFLCPPPVQSQPPLQPASPLPVPSPYTEQSRGLTERCEPASRPVLPVCTARRAPRSCPPPVPGTHTMALRPSSVRLRVPLPAPPESSLPAVPDPESDRARIAGPTLLDFAAACRLDYASALVAESVPASPPSVGGECALSTDVLEDRQEDFECLAAAVPRFASLLLALEGDPDSPDIPTPRSYAEAITGPYSSQWQAAMDAEMASWKSTGTYIDEVPPPGVNIVDGMWIFRVKQPSGSPPAFKARYVARGFSQRQGRDYELHSLDLSTAFLQGSLHEEIWQRRPPGSIGTTPAALGFAPSTADLSLFLRIDTSLPPFYVLVYVLQRFGFRYSSPQLTPLSTSHSLSAPPSDESVEPSGPYPELVGCLKYLMTCTRPDLAYPLSLLARYMAPGRHQKVHWDVAKRVLRYLCSTLGMGLVLGGRGPVVLTGHADASWVDDSATQWSSHGYTFSLGSGSVSWRSTRSSSVLSSSCEAEIYAGAMAAEEQRWLTYLLTDLGEQPRSHLVLYVDNKAMIALCQEHRLVHITKQIALRYFLARELQQPGQLRLAYVATRVNTTDVFSKALPPGDHQRFVTVLGLVPTLPHLLTS